MTLEQAIGMMVASLVAFLATLGGYLKWRMKQPKEPTGAIVPNYQREPTGQHDVFGQMTPQRPHGFVHSAETQMTAHIIEGLRMEVAALTKLIYELARNSAEEKLDRSAMVRSLEQIDAITTRTYHDVQVLKRVPPPPMPATRLKGK